MSETFMLTTIDNPYNPFDQFDQWFIFDVEHGYDTCSVLARIAVDSDQLSEEEEKMFMEQAMDEIIACDFMNLYKKVKESDFKKQKT